MSNLVEENHTKSQCHSNMNYDTLVRPDIIDTTMKPEEMNWFIEFAQYCPGRARSFKRIMNSYNVSRLIAEKKFEGTLSPSFRRKLLKMVILVEVWPCRMSWLIQIAEDAMQEHRRKQELLHCRYETEVMCLKDRLSLDVVLYRFFPAYENKLRLLYNKVPLVSIYQSVVSVLIHSSSNNNSNDFSPSRDGDPQLFEMFLQEHNKSIMDRLVLSDLQQHDAEMEVMESSKSSIIPYIFNLPFSMLEKASQQMDEIEYVLKEEPISTIKQGGDEKRALRLFYREKAKYYEDDVQKV